MASGQRVGYIRVSSVGQNPERQLDAVEADTVFTDTGAGQVGPVCHHEHAVKFWKWVASFRMRA